MIHELIGINHVSRSAIHRQHDANADAGKDADTENNYDNAAWLY